MDDINVYSAVADVTRGLIYLFSIFVSLNTPPATCAFDDSAFIGFMRIISTSKSFFLHLWLKLVAIVMRYEGDDLIGEFNTLLRGTATR